LARLLHERHPRPLHPVARLRFLRSHPYCEGKYP
jgi:hypothetical protein